MREFIESCEKVTDLIVSCWDENNPDDGKTFDERLAEKTAHLEGTDQLAINKVKGLC